MDAEKAKQIYWGAAPLPDGAESLGEHVDGQGRRGCLIRLASGVHVVGNAGVFRSTPTRDQNTIKK